MQKLPRSLKDFWLYYWRHDPKRWIIFILQDLAHFSRYQIAFVFVGLCVDSLVNGDPSGGVPQMAWISALAVFGVLAFGESMHIWTAYTIHKWKPALRAKIRSDFFEYMLGHSHAYYQNNFAGSLARKVTEIAESSMRLHDHLRFSIFGSLVAMTSATIALFVISPLYATGLLLFIASVTLPVIWRIPRISGRGRDFSEVRAKVTGTVVDILSNAASMRNFANAGYELSQHASDTARERKSDQKRILTLIQLENYRRASLVLLGSGMMVALLIGWAHGIVTVGQVSAAMGMTFSLVGATWMFGWGVVMTADELGYIDDAIRMLVRDYDVVDDKDAGDMKIKNGSIRFDNVSFEYENCAVFSKMNLEIPACQKVGLMGPSGAGKSTFVNLLLRFYDLQDGSISIDGQDISKVAQESLRQHIAVIPQDTSLFHRSLAENIRYGRLDATDEEVIEAAKKAHAHEFIDKLPQGYDTLVGERGIKLSGGQRQRIAIARAILRDAPILILDEATSALDSESEKLIQESLAELMEGKTVIAIAHRLSTIAHLDRLLVMENGAIIEDGTHKELLKQKGHYAKLWTMQSGGFLVEEDDQREDADTEAAA